MIVPVSVSITNFEKWLILKKLIILAILLIPLTASSYNDNCWEFVKTQVPNLPSMAEIVPNSDAKNGTVVIMEYQKPDRVIPHVAFKVGVFENGSIMIGECNMWHLYKTGCGYRVIPPDYKNLIGFYE